MSTLSTTWDICLHTWALVQVTFVYRHEMETTNSTLQMCYIWFIFCELMCRFVFWNWYLTLLQEENEVNKEQCATCQNPRQWDIITPPISVSTRCCCFFGFCFFSPRYPWNFQNHKIIVSPHHTTCIVSTFLINTFLVQLNVMVCQCVCLYLNVSGHMSTYPQHHHGHPCENTFL